MTADVVEHQTAMVAIPPLPSERFSVYADSTVEALKFKWLESEKVGYDLGELALKRWVKQFWAAYLRARLLEHLEGKRFWAELDRNDFGLLLYAFHDDPQLLKRIIDRLRCGDEYLQLVTWACDCDLPMNRVRPILEKININARRLDPIVEPDY